MPSELHVTAPSTGWRPRPAASPRQHQTYFFSDLIFWRWSSCGVGTQAHPVKASTPAHGQNHQMAQLRLTCVRGVLYPAPCGSESLPPGSVSLMGHLRGPNTGILSLFPFSFSVIY
jgi:hypothetical protein